MHAVYPKALLDFSGKEQFLCLYVKVKFFSVHLSNSCQWEENVKSQVIQENLRNSSETYILISVHLAFFCS